MKSSREDKTHFETNFKVSLVTFEHIFEDESYELDQFRSHNC